ncbi:MAG: ArnT family glycosyltransferase [Candidatus Margulisiibacteriota bacterium]
MNKILWWVLAVFIFISFATLSRNPLLNDDAALYALAIKNAILFHQWLAQFVTPGDLSSFVDKPPLGIWLLSWFPKFFGINEYTIHFPNVIYYTLLLLIMYLTITRISSRKIAFYTTLIAATSLCLIIYARAPKLDILLTLFVFLAHLSFYYYLKKTNPLYLYFFTFSLIGGFLVKSGFGLLFPALTILFLFISNARIRKIVSQAIFSPHFLLCGLLFVFFAGGVLCLQSLALKEQWFAYLKSIFVQSKYNSAYLGLGFHYFIISFLLLTIFPWTPLFLTTIKLKFKNLTLNTFCHHWFWSNILFLLFFYQQNDLRTFTVFVPPLAILASIRLTSLEKKISSFKLHNHAFGEFFWSLFFLILFASITIVLLFNPVNPKGYSLKSALLPFALFTFALAIFTFYLWKPNQTKLVTAFILICFAYSVLFYHTRSIANVFNANLSWPKIIKAYKNRGWRFYIYRPTNRRLFFSPDLCWVDFMAGPADKYFWDKNELQKEIGKKRFILLSDTESWNKTKLKSKKIVAQDDYSGLFEVNL